MNFVYDPKIAAQIARVRQLRARRSRATQEELAKIDPEPAKNPLVFPSDEMLAKAAPVRPGRRSNNADYIEKWQKVLGA